MRSDVCMPAWAQEGGACPHGFAVHLPGADFTWPNDPSLLDGLAAFYSCMPFLAVVTMFGVLLWRLGIREAYFIVFSYPVLGLMTFFLKALIKERRPQGSCLITCGMPSGHAMFSIGLLTLLVAELITRGSPPVPKLPSIAILTLTLLPVGWSRTQLHDHSLLQVIIGSCIGAVLGLAYFWLLRLGVRQGWPKEIACRVGLVDNYSPQEDRKTSESTPLSHPTPGSAPSLGVPKLAERTLA